MREDLELCVVAWKPLLQSACLRVDGMENENWRPPKFSICFCTRLDVCCQLFFFLLTIKAFACCCFENTSGNARVLQTQGETNTGRRVSAIKFISCHHGEEEICALGNLILEK
jgi:hypothetical protein